MPGAFSALRFAVGILGFSTQQPALFGENAVENVQNYRQHNTIGIKAFGCAKKGKQADSVLSFFAFFMISVFACVRFFGNGRSGYSFRSRYSRSFCAESRRGQQRTAPFQWLPAAECPKYSQQRSDPVEHKGNHPRNQTLPQRQSGSPLAAQFPPHGGHRRHAGGVQQAEYQQRPGGQR